MLHVLILSLALLQSPQQPQQPTPPMGTPKPLSEDKVEKCTIEGKVTSAVDGQPLKKAVLTLMPQQQTGGFMQRPPTALTDADGKFLFKDLDAGRYTLGITRNGYARQTYGQRVAGGPGTTVALVSGQALKDILVRLYPGASVNGRIVDEDNEPISGVRVQAMRMGYMRGKRQLVAGGFGATDDRGLYRIYGLPPGRYFISATYTSPFAVGIGTGVMITGSGGESSETYAPTYYPGTHDASQAGALDLRAGEDLSNISFRLVSARAVRVSGLVRGTDGQPVKDISVQLWPRNPTGGMMIMSNMGQATDSKGNFSFPGVMPGSYFAIAQNFADDSRQSGRTEVEVGSDAVDNVVINLGAGVDIRGDVHLDGAVDLTKSTVRVYLGSDEMLPIGSMPAEIKDNTFTLTRVPDGTFTLRVMGLPDDAYIRSATFAERDVLAEPLRVRGAGGDLSMTISAAGAHLEGSVSDKDNKPFTGAQVVLVPEESKRSRQDLFRTATTDQYGHFAMRGITPGSYKLFAWEAIDSGAYQDPDFLKAYEDQGKTVQLGPSERSSPELKVIPSAKTGS